MPCDKYKQLENEYRSAVREYAYFAMPENKQLRGMSDRQSRQMAKAAQEKQRRISREITIHRQECEECKKGERGFSMNSIILKESCVQLNIRFPGNVARRC